MVRGINMQCCIDTSKILKNYNMGLQLDPAILSGEFAEFFIVVSETTYRLIQLTLGLQTALDTNISTYKLL